MLYNTLLTDLKQNILIVHINRPDKLNALNKEVFDELEQVLNEVYISEEIRSVIITGAGEKSFVAGADISELVKLNVSEAKLVAERGQKIFQRIEDCTKPIIAVVNGFALGGGCELAMACHFRIASPNAKFGQPEVNLGLIPGYGGTQRLVQLIGKGRAIELLISGNMIDADTALQYGLVNAIVPQPELLEKAVAILNKINTKAPYAIAKCIEAANAVYNETKNGFSIELDGFANCFATEDMKEGTSAFLEKRAPKFKGK